TTTFVYDEVGNKTSETDAKGNSTHFQYDAANRLVKTIDALTFDIEFAYDARGNRISIWDQNNNETAFAYDLNNRLTQIAEPEGAGGASETTMTYDEVGNLLTRTDPNGNTVSRQYDALNRLVLVSYPNSATVAFTYDGRGNRKALNDGNAGVEYSYQYDDRSLLTQFTNATWSKTLSYQHDAAGKRTAMTTPEGDVITYTHDAADRIDTITRGTQLVADYDYDLAGRREKLTVGNGCYTDYGYDDLNRLQNVHNCRANDETISSFSYTHDEVNNRTTITFANGDVVSFGYDARYQLTSEVREDMVAYNESLTYDPAGNRLTRSKNSSLTTYSYNAANQLVGESTDGVPTAYLYDANGNMTQKSVGGGAPETWTYGFDYHNRLVSAVSTTGVSASYVFDYDVRRLSKTTNGATECFVYDGDDIIADYVGSTGGLPGVQTASYVNSVTIDSKLARIDGPGSGTPGAWHWYLYDALGSVRSVVGAVGGIENEYVQNAWGEEVPGAGQQTLADRYQFTGRELDLELGLMHYRNRCYIPSAGRFMQKDPSGMPEGPNRYAYVRNNPVNAVDPWGLNAEDESWGSWLWG
ncbi:MAG: RHS repeat-associated core domain-containing protein, partial [Planctomycetota bacterium]|nr:RHS repeat-associated core domain-containing protein [Planctomycetota bacterium]